jgi:hypothetical protein
VSHYGLARRQLRENAEKHGIAQTDVQREYRRCCSQKRSSGSSSTWASTIEKNYTTSSQRLQGKDDQFSCNKT